MSRGKGESSRAIPDNLAQCRLLTIYQVAEFLGVRRAKVYDLMNDPEDPLPSIKFHGNRRFQSDKILWWVEKHETDAVS